jgi:hypothetical protein
MINISLKRAAIIFLLISLYTAALPQSPVAVAKEPFHKLIFSNEYVRILEVHIPPHDTTQYHIHQTNSAIVFLSTNKTGSQVMGGKPLSGHSLLGNTTYAAFGDSPVTHRVWNDDTTVYHVFDIELPHHSKGSWEPVINNPELSVVWENNLARAYHLDLNPNGHVNLEGSDHPHLLIRISGSPTPFRQSMSMTGKLRPIFFVWYPAGTAIDFTNKETVPEKCIILELK